MSYKYEPIKDWVQMGLIAAFSLLVAYVLVKVFFKL